MKTEESITKQKLSILRNYGYLGAQMHDRKSIEIASKSKILNTSVNNPQIDYICQLKDPEGKIVKECSMRSMLNYLHGPRGTSRLQRLIKRIDNKTSWNRGKWKNYSINYSHEIR